MSIERSVAGGVVSEGVSCEGLEGGGGGGEGLVNEMDWGLGVVARVTTSPRNSI